jgi:hypothetical protein
MTTDQVTKIRQALREYIQNKDEYFRSPSVETEKTPTFLVYASRGNDRETLNLYFDYKTSKKFINRAIFSLGFWEDFPASTIKDLETLAAVTLQGLDIEAKRVKDTYQSEGSDP